MGPRWHFMRETRQCSQRSHRQVSAWADARGPPGVGSGRQAPCLEKSGTDAGNKAPGWSFLRADHVFRLSKGSGVDRASAFRSVISLRHLLTLPTTLLTRLLIGHVTPVLIVTVALVVTMMSLLRITHVLRDISDMELSSLHRESALHRASWSLDVTMRRHERACRVAPAGEPARTEIVQQRQALEQALRSTPEASDTMRGVARGWLDAAARALGGDICSELNRLELQTERAQLDDRMTELWASRLNELHSGLEEKDQAAQLMGARAVLAGAALSGGSVLLAMFLARRMARSVNVPLRRLAKTARLVGRGRFDTEIEVKGPAEIVALAEELARMQRQLAELETLKQGFLASVSHELRTPLSKIREALALLSDGVVGELDDQQLRVVRIARVACEREIRMVTTLLDLSRLRTGSHLRLRDAVSVDSVIEAAITDESEEARSRSVRVVFDVDPPPAMARLDPVLLERALANLVRNAVSVSRNDGHVLVQRRCVSRPGYGGRWARVRVVDEGPGVPEEIRETVFQAFVTQAVSSSPKALGVGLGLALAREVARAHGGDLMLEETTSGATFELWLPLEAPRAEGAPPMQLAELSL
jgi:two-component system, NtrC family, sensor histidine kinase GlrK